MKKLQHMMRTVATTVIAGSLCLSFASAALIGAGTVTDSGLRLRADANTESTVLGTASKNDMVIVLERASDNWYKVSYNSKTGYMSGDYLKIASVADTSLGNGVVDTDGSVLRLRAAAGTNGGVLANIPDEAILKLEGVSNGWYKVTYNGTSGYVSGDYVHPTSSASTASTAVSSQSTTSTKAPNSAGEAIVAAAKQYLGVKYVYGGSSPSGFDCSGFTQYVMRQCGYSINRTASTQLKNGTSISQSELQAGDLVFFKKAGSSYAATHVGIYIGNNQFIHASTNDYTVRIDSLKTSWYANTYTGARRIAS